MGFKEGDGTRTHARARVGGDQWTVRAIKGGGSAVCSLWSTGCRESVTAKSRNGNGSRIDDNQPGGRK
jgi:hypothetical protein